MYAIYDKKTAVYDKPFLSHNDGDAMRAISDAMSQDNMLSRHPEDFSLNCIGEYDDLTACIQIYPVKVVAELNELINVN